MATILSHIWHRLFIGCVSSNFEVVSMSLRYIQIDSKILLGSVWRTYLFFIGSPGSTRCNWKSRSFGCKGKKNSLLGITGRKIQTHKFLKTLTKYFWIWNYLVNYFDDIICLQHCSRVPQDQLGHLEKMVQVAIQVQLVLLALAVPEVKVALQ